MNESTKTDNNRDAIMKKEGKDVFSADWTRYTGIGFEMFTSVAVFGVIGYLVDWRWNTWPIGLISGTLFGVVIGFYMVIKDLFLTDKALWKYMKDDNDRKEDGDGKSGRDEGDFKGKS
jgi:F0F1-type ATP synthase assembly protein I